MSSSAILGLAFRMAMFAEEITLCAAWLDATDVDKSQPKVIGPE